MKRFNDARDWFLEKRFGLFIHWGIYAVGGVHEQELQRYGKPWAEYLQYQREFNPVNFNPDAWIDLAQECGMEYIVFTTKHHDGFCMWDTKETEFNIMHTPYGRDILKELADACHRRNMPLELYYSAVDWHHPNYPNLGRHHEITTDPALHDMDKYMRFLKNQITELCTNYGEIHGIWWDMNVPELHDPSVNALIRQLQPAAVINNRGYDEGDYSTPERHWGESAMTAYESPCEACDSVGANSWGYRRDEDYFSARYLETKMAKFMALGANFLLNAGPAPDGRFPAESAALLRQVGAWYCRIKEALNMPFRSGMVGNPDIVCTGAGNTLYVFMLKIMESSALPLAPLDVLPEHAVLLNTGAEIMTTLEQNSYQRDSAPCLRLRHIPVEALAGEIPVFKLTLPVPLEQIRKQEGQDTPDIVNYSGLQI